MIRSITYIKSFYPNKVSLTATVSVNGVHSIMRENFGGSTNYVILYKDGTNVKVNHGFVMIVEIKPKKRE